jgi:hypothetical protein
MTILIYVNVSSFSKDLIFQFLDLFSTTHNSVPVLFMTLSLNTRVKRCGDSEEFLIYLNSSDASIFPEYTTPFVSIIKDKKKIKDFNSNPKFFVIGTKNILRLNKLNSRYKADLLAQIGAKYRGEKIS